MRIAALLTGFLLLLVSAAVVGDDKWTSDRDTWNGFGVGSWVVQEESFTKDDKTESKREKHVRVDGNKSLKGIQIKRMKEGKERGVFADTGAIRVPVAGYYPPFDPNAKLLESSKQDLKIQGKTYTCEVKKYQINNGEDKATITFWHSNGANVPYRELAGPPRSIALPSDVLRVDVDYKGKEETSKTSISVVNFRVEHQIGDKKVICVREEGTIETSVDGQQAKGKITQLLSKDVPGHEVELVTEGEFAGMKIRGVKRIVAFKVIKD